MVNEDFDTCLHYDLNNLNSNNSNGTFGNIYINSNLTVPSLTFINKNNTLKLENLVINECHSKLDGGLFRVI